MKIGLIDPNDAVGAKNYQNPIGLLRIAAPAELQGHEVEIKHLHELLYSPKKENKDKLIENAVELLGEKGYDLLGFTTRSDTLPVALEIGGAYKNRYRDTTLVLGGPGANKLKGSK